ncbi:flagellar assembly protein A [Parageobacillus sp. KH3-4]|jgi:uncharacterized protein|uniref:flagellar assembly protein A n=1 Tax=Parageobacillus sp. KH3-4 TaxID=2916802 RepID=UPI001FCA9330|nr:flagellar assembly protein A [Parageobacillus sp. KH3-4]BDG45741.1 hypothetical protein PspKH34_03020 [Parageobacillus sp. KH3-4]
MHSVVSKGKDIKEAIELGLALLGTEKENVNIEIIQTGTKGFLGIGSKPAIVKLTKLESADALQAPDKNDSIEQTVSEMNIEEAAEQSDFELSEREHANANHMDTKESDALVGKAWVKDGALFCKASPTHFPTVTIGEGVKLYRNNELVKEKTTIVTENDVYEIKVENEKKDTKWKIWMDEKKLKVFLYIEPGYKTIRKLPDIEPSQHIELVVEEYKEAYNTLSYSDVMQKLESLQVKHRFIHQEQIVKALEAKEPGTYEIATGVSAKEGKNGWVELNVDLQSRNGPVVNEDGKVDYREIRTIPAVDRGQVIATIHPPVPGQPGVTVTNESIPPKQTYPVVLRTGKGIITVGDKIVATESGRPQVEQRGRLVKVSIMPKLTHTGNVDLSSGNIHFIGDVEIFGEVEKNMVVEAKGDIIVHKTVNMASLVASGAIITYSNIISSEISAGKHNMLVAELGHLLGIIQQNMEKMIGVIRQLVQSPAFKSSDFSRGGLQPLIRILLEKKFQGFPPLVKKYVEVVRKGENYLDDDVWKEIAVSLTKLFLSLTNEVISLEWIMQLSQKMKELHEVSTSPVQPDSYISIPSALNSRIYCSGDVFVTGKGCINTKIHAGGALRINGVVRGGEVYGRLGVEINETGSERGISTVIAVPHDQKIRINKAMEGTVLKIGNAKHTLKETRHHVVARIDKDDRIVFE